MYAMLYTKYQYRIGIGHFYLKSIGIGSIGENRYQSSTNLYTASPVPQYSDILHDTHKSVNQLLHVDCYTYENVSHVISA